jgi:hypothetical protein
MPKPVRLSDAERTDERRRHHPNVVLVLLGDTRQTEGFRAGLHHDACAGTSVSHRPSSVVEWRNSSTISPALLRTHTWLSLLTQIDADMVHGQSPLGPPVSGTSIEAGHSSFLIRPIRRVSW